MKNLIPVLFFLLIISCSLFDNEADDFEASKEKWEAQKAEGYEFRYGLSCFCPQVTPAIIVVDADTIYQVLDPAGRDSLMIQTGENTFRYAGDIYKESYKTVDELFEIIREARGADELDVEYNSESGFPMSINIDYEKNTADDEVLYTVSNYIPYRFTTQ
ncbi:MAG: DUF6174 domain-containing protein [Balneola sp.]